MIRYLLSSKRLQGLEHHRPKNRRTLLFLLLPLAFPYLSWFHPSRLAYVERVTTIDYSLPHCLLPLRHDETGYHQTF